MNTKPTRMSELLARIDQWLADAEALSALPADDETRQSIEATLTQLQKARQAVEGKLRAE